MGHWVEGVYYKTLTEVSNKYDIELSTLSRRMSRGRLTAEEAVTKFVPKTIMGREVTVNGRSFLSCSEVEDYYGLPDNSFLRTMDKTGWPPEICLLAIQRNVQHSRLYVYEKELYFSMTELAEAHGLTLNNLKACMLYHNVDCITALEIRLGKIKPPKKEEREEHGCV